jgi:predicted RND superfamily exporter protein
VKKVSLVRLVMVLATVLSAWLSTFHLRLSSDLTDLFPNHGEATMLTRYLRAFGGGDLGVILIRGADAHEVELTARELGDELRQKRSVVRVLEEAPLPRGFDPTLAWSYAGPSARARLERALTPEGMRERLRGTRELLLAPGATEVEEWLARDPLRLAMIPWEAKTELAAGLEVGTGGLFTADEGRARLVVAEPRGSAFDAAAALAFVTDARTAMEAARSRHPGVTTAITGGHAIAVATADMLRRDMIVSGVLSTFLASFAFLVTFRRMRALAAVLPPLGLGTLWTTGLAALFPAGLSAIATAFAAVVIGVGVDTGVHVYAALLDGRRRGLAPAEAAAYARRATWKPTLLAAIAAGLAFASLAASDLAAVRQLGLLCGAGEVLTAIGILLVTPEIGALLERKPPPPALSASWTRFVLALTATRPRAIAALALAVSPIALVSLFGWPSSSDTLVAIRPSALEPLRTQKEIYRLFSGKEGQWLVVTVDPDRERAAARADAVAETLDRLVASGDVAGFDSLTSFAPALATQRARLAARDALDLPAKRSLLEAALVDVGFDPSACATGLDAFASPSHEARAVDPVGPLAWIVSRHLATDAGETLVVSYVRPSGDRARDERTLAAIRAADPGTVVTGYHHLESALRAALAHDLPIVLAVALVLVVIALRAVLTRASDVVLALATILVEVGAVALVMRLCHVRWHVYDALVLPVLIGITMDESMFLLHAVRGAQREASSGGSLDAAIAQALREQGPLVVATALTTATGFGALLACKFEGLFDLGAVGALGSALGLVSALIVVPAGLRLTGLRLTPARSS